MREIEKEPEKEARIIYAVTWADLFRKLGADPDRGQRKRRIREGSNRTFTPDHPPISGKAKRLWDGWIAPTGAEPAILSVERPGKWQRSAGSCPYCINHRYLVGSVEDTLNMELAEGDRVDGDVGLR